MKPGDVVKVPKRLALAGKRTCIVDDVQLTVLGVPMSVRLSYWSKRRKIREGGFRWVPVTGLGPGSLAITRTRKQEKPNGL